MHTWTYAAALVALLLAALLLILKRKRRHRELLMTKKAPMFEFPDTMKVRVRGPQPEISGRFCEATGPVE
jgi:LPXTG-motif cell wall-anchored protein